MLWDRGALLEKMFAPSEAGSDNTNRCCHSPHANTLILCEHAVRYVGKRLRMVALLKYSAQSWVCRQQRGCR